MFTKSVTICLIANLNLSQSLELAVLLEITKREQEEQEDLHRVNKLALVCIVHRIHLRLQDSARNLQLGSIFKAMSQQKKM